MKNWMWILIFFGFGNLAVAQSNEKGEWYGYAISKGLNQSIGFNLFLQYRASENISVEDKYLLLTSLNFRPPGKKFAFGIYNYTLQSKNIDGWEGIPVNMQFLGQEVAYFHSLQNVHICHKIRLEQVWKKNSDFYQQGRLYSSIKLPLVHNSNKINLVTSSEIFWKLNASGFIRNRMFIGVDIQPEKHIGLNVGLIHEKYRDKNNNYLSVTVNQKL